MQLRNHIASYFLTGEKPVKWILNKFIAQGATEDEAKNVWDNIKPDNQPIFYITNTITDKIHLLKLKSMNWNVFNDVEEGKRIFIFKNGDMMWSFLDDGIWFFLYCNTLKLTKENAECHYIPIRAILETNDILTGDKTNFIYDILYPFLCFFFLSDIETKLVKAGQSHGTKKQVDALVNDLKYPVTIVNSNWNITSIRHEGFNVSGHFRLAKVGIGRNSTRMIFIEPFRKHGYVRHATKELADQI